MGLLVIIATFAIGSATKVDGQRAELQQGRDGKASEQIRQLTPLPHHYLMMVQVVVAVVAWLLASQCK